MRWFSTLIRKRRAATLAAIVVVQAPCTAFFIGDVIADISEGHRLKELETALETTAAAALCCGVVYLMLELRSLLRRMSAMDAGLRAARGEMANLVDSFFDRWGLTPSERDAALLILKGFDNEAIARLRGTAAGTVRAQSTRAYQKTGVDGRAQLISVFMEELLTGDGLTNVGPDLGSGGFGAGRLAMPRPLAARYGGWEARRAGER